MRTLLLKYLNNKIVRGWIKLLYRNLNKLKIVLQTISSIRKTSKKTYETLVKTSEKLILEKEKVMTKKAKRDQVKSSEKEDALCGHCLYAKDKHNRNGFFITLKV